VARELFELVDERTGVVRSVSRLSKSCREPELPLVYQSRLANFDFRNADITERVASGKAMTDEAAGLGAIAEALERYCACQPDVGRLILSAAADLPELAIPPDALVLYSTQQYADPRHFRVKPEPGQKLTWILGRCVGAETPAFVPASLVYMNFAGRTGSEAFAPATSNGLAAGRDLPSAILAGLYELIERDAFVIGWLNRIPARRIVFDEKEGNVGIIVQHYRRYGVEIAAFDITTDIAVPAIMGLAIDRSGALPAVVVGLGCSLSPAVALERALMEICQVRAGGAARYGESAGLRLPKRYEDVRTLEDHAAFAASPANLPEFSFLFDHAKTRGLVGMPDCSRGDASADLEFCRQRLEAVGSTACYVDITLPDIEPFAIRVVRCFATGLQPIHFGYGEERLGGERLFAVPRILGHRDRYASENDMNRCPHPLA